jgi:hypothetical protein
MSATVHRLPSGKTKNTLLLRIELLGTVPAVWRRISLPDTITLPRLHQTIQAVMGWSDCHMHEFEIAGVRYGEPDPDWYMPDPIISEKRVRLASVLGRHRKFHYVYDFGDHWAHQITVEKRLPDDGVPHPVCLDGENACPPEDVGGVPGYACFLEAISDPEHPDHEELREWCGDTFDPAAFNLQITNDWLARIKC